MAWQWIGIGGGGGGRHYNDFVLWGCVTLNRVNSNLHVDVGQNTHRF